MAEKQDTASRVDKIVAEFTRDISRLANEKGVDFDFAGVGPDKAGEIERVMDINAKIVTNLLTTG